ncbi:MAG TPA: bifunctional ADP-dependent NAD(P)H-hydrate dehydratase/NAD(P)H-hydrate epimerase [Marinilabiliales bacterium]|nr:bifunctional ADP-dependent NAD(P)H-hydrate dehydratase/NAD(P)H-hydrate epimerase [Marinilabiliales bacterium]
MKILPVEKIRQCDAYTISHEPISSLALMERAANSVFQWILEHITRTEPFVIFAGTGNNGGDALVLARLLAQAGYTQVQVFVLKISNKFSPDCEANLKRLTVLKGANVSYIQLNDPYPDIMPAAIVIDGIFGTGLSKPISGYWASLIDHINANASEIIAIDVPSGLFGDTNNEAEGSIIKANITLSFQFPKLTFFFAENHPFIGDWTILDIGLHPDFIEQVSTGYIYLEKHMIRELLKTRSRFDHKGVFGHAFLIAGSYQKTGAAVLSAHACLRTGVGLLTVHVPQSGYQIMQTAVPEAMLCIDETESGFCKPDILEKFQALGIGPGIGLKQGMRGAVKLILETAHCPLVLDADALNILADTPELLNLLPHNSILTPHPGEFDRLTKKHSLGFERHLSQMQFSKEHQVYVVLKGAFTSISTPKGEVYFNSTGNPGMATAGSGDVLTGIILSLLAQGYSPKDAAFIGVYLHGLAADLAASKIGEEALIASDIIEHLGFAFQKIKEL